VLRQEVQHGGADLVRTVREYVGPPQQGVVAERDKTRIREILHDASYALGGGLLVPGENQQPRGKATDGMRGDHPWTHEGEGGKQCWVRGGESRPIRWRPAREVGLVNAQVLEQLKNPFLDRQRCFSCHALSR
jgi:hypothetical protein